MTSDYSPAAFSFAISFRDDGAEAIDGAFQEVSGLDNERQVHDLEEGGENRFVHAFPGSIKHSNLVLKRGQLATTSRLFAWCRQTFEGGLAQAGAKTRHPEWPALIRQIDQLDPTWKE